MLADDADGADGRVLLMGVCWVLTDGTDSANGRVQPVLATVLQDTGAVAAGCTGHAC